MLLSISVDFRHADVSTRERFHPTVEQLAKLYDSSRSRPGALDGEVGRTVVGDPPTSRRSSR